MSEKELIEIQRQKKQLKKDKSNGVYDKDKDKDTYYLKLMEIEDDEMLIRIEGFDEEFKKASSFIKSMTEDFMQTIGNMQRYNTELTKARFNKHKAKRYRDKVYNEKYEFYKRGGAQIQLKTSKDFDVMIGKDSRYARTNSYCETYEILIKYLEEAVKQLSQKIFVLQSLIKSREYDTGPF